MTQQDHGAENTAALVATLLDMLSDPAVVAKLRVVQQHMKSMKRETIEPGFHVMEATRGTCPTCKRRYAINRSQRTLRRHGTGKCHTHDQIPAELIPAIRVISAMGTSHGESGKSN